MEQARHDNERLQEQVDSVTNLTEELQE